MIKSAEIRQETVDHEEIGVFIKAGSIIARKYNRRMSILKTLTDNYLLDIYPTVEQNQRASGFLYLDDGETFGHSTKQ